MISRIYLGRGAQIRWVSTKINIKLNEDVNESVLNKIIHPKKHPGILGPKAVETPPWLISTIKEILESERISRAEASKDVEKLTLHLRNRRPPIEFDEFQRISQNVYKKLYNNDQNNADEMPSKTEEELRSDKQFQSLLKSNIYNWMPIEYNKYKAILYAISRSIQEYTVLYKILNEINLRDQTFKPKTLYDFGSGIGTVMWAANNVWPNTLKEYCCIDASPNMNALSEQFVAKTNILRDAIFYRQFLSMTAMPFYDIVVSAYSLLELPSAKARLELILNLWQKTDQYLVIVEQGSMAGFMVVNEVRDFILSYVEKQSKKHKQDQQQAVHVFSPCPHEYTCPRYKEDDTPCNFEIPYYTLPIFGTSEQKYERFSYVVLKKADRSLKEESWPRIVRPVLRRSGHVICRTCTPFGKLKEEIITVYKNGKPTYKCAKQCKWGDLLPVYYEKGE